MILSLKNLNLFLKYYKKNFDMRFSNYSKFPMKNILIFLLFLTLTFSDNVTTSSFTIDGPTHDIVWCGSEEVSGLWDSNTTQPIYLKKTVFVVSGKGTVYRSINEGANFENIKPKLVKAASQFGKSNAVIKIH